MRCEDDDRAKQRKGKRATKEHCKKPYYMADTYPSLLKDSEKLPTSQIKGERKVEFSEGWFYVHFISFEYIS